MRKEKELPPVLKELKIPVPKQGLTVITIKKRDEDPESVSVLIEEEGKVKSYSWARVSISETHLVITFKNGILIENEPSEEEK